MGKTRDAKLRKKLIQRAAALVVCAGLLCPAASAARYTDVPGEAWYAQGVDYCKLNGLLVGTGEGRFSPEGTVSRAMLAAVLYRLAGSPAVEGELPFRDTDPALWYGAPVLWSSQAGHMVGYGDGRFGPDEPITHEQLASALWRYAGSPGGGEDSVPAGTSSWAGAAMGWAGSAGLLRGLESFTPREPSTRAQLAVVLMNYTCPDGIAPVSAMNIMCRPNGIAAMEDGSLLVTDTYNQVIWRVEDGASTIYAGGETVEDLYGQPVGGYNDASLPGSYFKEPWAIAPFLDGWAVSDANNGVVRLIHPNAVETVNGHTSERLEVTDLGVAFQRPTGLAAAPDGSLYVSDTGLDAIRRITPEGDVTTAASGLSEPMGLCWHGGALYIAETGANRISKLENGRVTVVAGSGQEGLTDGPAARATFSSPQGVAVAEDGTIYVSDTVNSAIRQIRDGQVSTLAARDVTDLQSFFPCSPCNLLVRGKTLYICDPFARKLLAFPLR